MSNTDNRLPIFLNSIQSILIEDGDFSEAHAERFLVTYLSTIKGCFEREMTDEETVDLILRGKQ